ncbi:MAG TPA: DUF2125 domain-containing protein [Acetobacteraceae bacterium]|jgi:hypothetical protein
MRRWLIVVLILLAALIAGDTLTWRWAEGQLESGFADWQAARRAEGWVVASGTPVRAGWPLQARLDIPAMNLSGGAPGQRGAVNWTADQVTLDVSPIAPNTLHIGFSGQQHFRLTGAPDIAFGAERMIATAPLAPTTPDPGISVEIGNLRATLPEGELTVTRLQLHGDNDQTFSLSAGDIALPPPQPGRSWPLGAHIASLVIAGTVTGEMPLTPAMSARAAAWRDAGGKLQLSHVSIGWGPLGITGNGELMLDGRLQPTGTAMLRIVGYDQALDALAAGGALPPRAAGAAKAVLGLLAHTPDGGGAPLVDAPLSLRDNELTLGMIPLARLPLLVWPDAQ